jgi:hypothetical protein
MSDTQNFKKDLVQMFEGGEAKPLEDLYDLEATSLIIRDLTKKIDFYKEYKKKKDDDINREIKKVSEKMEFLREVVLVTLQKHKEKSLKFPGTCSISTRKQKPKWIIQDEEEFIKKVEEAIANGESAKGVVEQIIEKHIVKKEADKLLDSWDQNGKLEEFLKEIEPGADAFVSKEPSTLSVSFTFEEKEKEEEDVESEVDIPQKKDQNYDGL